MTAASQRVARVAIARGQRPGTDRIEVRTQDGLTGFGEGYWGERGLRRAPEILLGRSPFEAEAIYDELAAADPDAPGGLDMALWDLMGKALGTASAALLGKTFRARVVACAAVGGAGPSGRLLDVAQRARDRRSRRGRVRLRGSLDRRQCR